MSRLINIATNAAKKFVKRKVYIDFSIVIFDKREVKTGINNNRSRTLFKT